MTNLRLPNAYVKHYPIAPYPVMGNLLRITEYNRGQMDDWILRTGYNLNNNHPLVNLLQLLAIDSSWTLEELVTIVRYKTNSVCSICNITNINRNAPSLRNVFYKDTREVLFVVYNDKQYVTEDVTMHSLTPIIPTYINTSFVNYNASIEGTSNGYTEKNQIAFIGIDVVDLAVGWWLYMNTHTGQGTGIHAYLVNHPLRKANLIHNQLNLVNALYEKAFNNVSFATSVASPNTSFFTLEEDEALIRYLSFLDKTFSRKRILHIDQMLQQINSIYAGPKLDPYTLIATNPGMVKRISAFNNLRWALDAMVLKLCRLYLYYANNGKYETPDINTDIAIRIDKMVNQYRIIDDKAISAHLIALALVVEEDNDHNLN